MICLVNLCVISAQTIFCALQVIAAVSYQIIPVDAQHAEVPLAAVSSKYQKKVCTINQGSYYHRTKMTS